jgi:excisionase family DNA binding protein
MPTTAETYLDPKEAADYLRSSTSTLAKLRHKRKGPAYTRIGVAIRYRRADLDAWMAGQLVRLDYQSTVQSAA